MIREESMWAERGNDKKLVLSVRSDGSLIPMAGTDT